VTASVDAVITDPPFFDNVHYSQLADFFYVWQCYVLGNNGHHQAASTRAMAEVQHSEAAVFTERLRGVWAECHRVLRHDGLLVFTYHHSRAEGWHCVLEALVKAGFVIVATHPIKAEMSVATPKRQAKAPIDLDVILVCRKGEAIPRPIPQAAMILDDAFQEAAAQIARLNNAGRSLSRNDVRVILMAQIIKRLSWQPSLEDHLSYLQTDHTAIERVLDHLCHDQQVVVRTSAVQEQQMTLW
jgi:adenine-specific DNA methylase